MGTVAFLSHETRWETVSSSFVFENGLTFYVKWVFLVRLLINVLPFFVSHFLLLRSHAGWLDKSSVGLVSLPHFRSPLFLSHILQISYLCVCVYVSHEFQFCVKQLLLQTWKRFIKFQCTNFHADAIDSDTICRKRNARNVCKSHIACGTAWCTKRINNSYSNKCPSVI